MALPYPTKVVLPFDIATAQDMNERHANDVALANGTGLDDGAVTTAKIGSGAVTDTKLDFNSLLAPLFTGFGSSVTSDTNAGSAGGTRYHVDLGGIKLCWGLTDSKTHSAGNGGNYTVSLPSSFFNSIQTSITSVGTAVGSVSSNTMIGVSTNTNNHTIGWSNETSSPGVGGRAAYLIIGS